MLLDQLIERQKTLGLSDDEFARQLRISRQLWQKTRTGEQEIGESVVLGVTARFPELQGDVLIFLRQKASRIGATASDNRDGRGRLMPFDRSTLSPADRHRYDRFIAALVDLALGVAEAERERAAANEHEATSPGRGDGDPILEKVRSNR